MVDQTVLEGIISTYGSKGGWEGFEARGRSCSWCREPIRLNSLTSRGGTEYFKACGNRRSTRCRACADRYRMDARVLVLAGLDGGKGIPEEIRSHPVVFATLTAPSFGAVHRSVSRNGRILPCRPGTKGPCVHGRQRNCAMTHGEHDKIVGESLCPDCYDNTGAVLFNALVPELWRRVTITTRRNLARLYGRTQGNFNEEIRLSFVKVVEYQRRGVIHLHAVARLDHVKENSSLDLDGKLLAMAIELAVNQVSLVSPYDGGFVSFGSQLDLQILEETDPIQRRGVAGYVAKYATKSSDDEGVLDRKIRSAEDLSYRVLTPHLRRLAETAWNLGVLPELAHLPLRRWAHTLGFRGHWLTKSRCWSTTFRYLRAERAKWQEDRRQQIFGVDDFNRPTPGFEFVGIGWKNPGEVFFAQQRQREIVEVRQMLRERLFSIPANHPPPNSV
ncbi:MAG TPA: replication initiator [Acidimicrobiales bacterium]|nr:replication initiator [Acidimicrobiales bacterium]